jgi:hypothetical protein
MDVFAGEIGPQVREAFREETRQEEERRTLVEGLKGEETNQQIAVLALGREE